ncbi:bifunctional [glutamate--ammonia ligase]-adenylyl-L-tyrosine phosphorylase/[glutamate--ammonia-ligase] adenylyltransferase [Sessilibacter corallicola]|uniref:bifunctional [glutamate--ammonia ligase]-adenylyl-L-tyrosine phosphorylase/[glutamate--ammonia-ligase] adenylyltransferase n=1 Tax=Sessilibacter corallicola TaxID=2904075 RepID=UPI001E47361A|nr:bifunctional [glutamate--ammonia ligase]-adenylyl-L-tyrosine phosphorylase/[glutamate--ammonia-ligase] adenylyltransferase [Sessilibacter corallicola]MCE2030426.1 bifunctional [glutamate--ammonia ligase]-adenylyl-L-tyrosine phosphorylase/[glutamate--ammonia-ligase] adenylyltransferase [Sessilibacter corallicola]
MSQFYPPSKQLTALVDKFCANFQERWPEQWQTIENRLVGDLREQFNRTLIASQYVQDAFLTHPDIVTQVVATLELSTENPSAVSHYQQLTDKLAALLDDENLPHEQCVLTQSQVLTKIQIDKLTMGWDKLVRQHRRVAMISLIWREMNQIHNHEQITAELSELASASVQLSMDLHYQLLALQHGVPIGRETKTVQPFIVLGMGKLGAWELNLSSDIDLIFAFPEAGETQPFEGQKVRKSLSNQEFFVRLGQKVIKSLDSQTADGFVFRVDMRLRPYGQSGALASNFLALEDYYQNQGREWERYAMIKARVIAQSQGAWFDASFVDKSKDDLMNLLRPFSYRRYVDYSVIKALRDLKAMINREVKLRGKSQDVKLGYGGIREVEFIAQAFQLIRGGREKHLQDRRLLNILPILGRLNCLPQEEVEALTAAYYFLRRAEHAIQAWADRQTQALPVDELPQASLAHVMGFEQWEDFYECLQQHRKCVNDSFQGVIQEPEETQVVEDSPQLRVWQAVVQGEVGADVLIEELNAFGFDQPEQTLELLREFSTSRALVHMNSGSRDRMDDIVGRLLKEVSELDWQFLNWELQPLHQSSHTVLTRLLPLLEATARRTAYLILMQENPAVLTHLVRLYAASVWISEQITRHPALLEVLIDAPNLHRVPDKQSLNQELNQALIGIPNDDLEAQMETLRYYRRSHALRVAACELSGALPLMKVSDYLTWLAEAILVQVLELAWNSLTERHGVPCDENGPIADKGFAIIAYGKLGGIELGHGSDLDLVFIHDSSSQLSTDGDVPLDNPTFYTRLGKKIIHILNTRTPSGRLYEVDMRLRPSGNSGLLVSSLQAFERYQNDQAWTWEHQALLRSRPVAGTYSLIEKFQNLREQILCRARDLKTLRSDVVEMRDKMRSHLGSKPKQSLFHLKQDHGGIVDIEFMVQYAALAWAHQHPRLVKYSDNIRILDEIEQAGLMPSSDVQLMVDAYKAYRSIGHRLALQQQPNVLPTDALLEYRQAVTSIWQNLMIEGELDSQA